MTNASCARGPVIVFLSTRYSVGGAQMNAVLLAEQVCARGDRAELWFLTRTGQMAPTRVPVRILSDDVPRGMFGWLALAARFFSLVRRTRPSAMFGFHPLACVLGGLAVLVGRYAFAASQNNPPESQTPALAWLEKSIGCTPLYAANIVVSQAVRDAYKDYPAAYRNKLAVVHNAAPPLPVCDDDKIASRLALGLPTGVAIVGNIGRLANQKNPEFLIETIRLAKDAHLMLAGEGPLAEPVRQLAERLGVSDRVHLIGRVEGQDLTRAYRSLDLFLMPSRFEGFGRSLVEALSCGAPVMAHDIPALREVGGNAVLLLPLEPDLWAAQIRALLAQPALRANMATAGRRRVQQFNLQAMTDGYLAAIGR